MKLFRIVISVYCVFSHLCALIIFKRDEMLNVHYVEFCCFIFCTSFVVVEAQSLVKVIYSLSISPFHGGIILGFGFSL